jgi:hypothetical protein
MRQPDNKLSILLRKPLATAACRFSSGARWERVPVVGAGEIATSALVGAAAAVASSGAIGARSERARQRETHRRAAERVLRELGNLLKDVRLQPQMAERLLTAEYRQGWAYRLLVEVDELGPVRRRNIRRALRGLVGAAAVQRIDELPPDSDGSATAARAVAMRSETSVLREEAWTQLQIEAGKGEEDLYLSGDLLAVVMAVRSKDDKRLQQVWRRMDGQLRSIGFWLGQWSQWRHPLRR